jgi:hypothetical protein
MNKKFSYFVITPKSVLAIVGGLLAISVGRGLLTAQEAGILTGVVVTVLGVLNPNHSDDHSDVNPPGNVG